MDGLSPATRALLESARDGDRLDGERREALRLSAATALGVGAAGTSRGATSTRWALRSFGALGTTGAAVAVAVCLHGALAHGPAASPAIGPRVEAAGVTPYSAPVTPFALDARAAPSAFETPETSLASTPIDVPVPPGPAEPPRPLGPHEHHAVPDGDALAAEARLLAAAQSALDAGHGASALALLDEHDRRFPSGVLAPESEALRIDALCAAGRADDAKAEALRLRARDPASPARRLSPSCVNGTR